MDTLEKFEGAYINIARKLRIPGAEDPKFDVLQGVAEYLAETNIGPWLLVLDNADDVDLLTKPRGSKRNAALATYLPRSSSGRMLITTRDAHVGLVMTGRHPIEVTPLSSADASMLLRASLLNEDNPEEKVVLQILSILDNLPLAITQASAYIKRNNITAAQYLEELTESEAGLQALLSEDQFDLRRGIDSINSVVRTWKLSFDRIQIKYSGAAKLLCIMSALNRQNIPRDLLRSEGQSQQQLTTALGVLQSFSLIKAERGANTFSMHRLVQFVTCVWQKLQSTEEVHREEALRLVAAKFPKAETDNRRLCQLLLPHAYALQAYEFRACQETLAELQYNTSWYEVQQGHYHTARESCQQSLDSRRRKLGLGNLKTLHAAGLLGTIMKYQGNYAEATSVQKDILAQKEIMLGPDDLDTIQSLSDLTDLYTRQGDYNAAEKAARRVLEARVKVLGPEHLKSLSIHTTLAHILMLRGRHEEAELLTRETLEKYNRILGSEHLITLICTSVLYLILQDLGQYEEAIKLCNQVINGRRKHLGPEHIFTLTAINNLARLQRATGEFEIAEKLYRDILPISEKSLGVENPETMAMSSNLAVVLRDQGEFQEAGNLFRQTLERRERVLGKENPRTLITLNEYAIWLNMEGKYDEAEVAASRVLKARVETLGEMHPESLEVLCTRAAIMHSTGRLEDAKEMYERALEGRRKVLRINNPDTLACLFELGLVLEDMMLFKDAYEHFSESWEQSARVLGKDHRLTLMRFTKMQEVSRKVKDKEGT
jgi:tetratricopeptide (TPR) repeat protein